SFVPALVLTDGGAAVNLELAVWLNPLPYYADHSRLEFDLGPANFTVDPTGAFFDLTDPVVESGDLNNEIDVVATAIGITTQPPALVGVNQSFLVRAGFVDENGGVDEDWPDENITLSVNTGIGNLSAVTGLTIMSANGQSNFYNLLYDALDTGVILEATSTSLPGPALTNPFDTFVSPTITCDVAPLCWDGDATDEAIPFAVHITIENWTDAAGEDVQLKVYSGSYNPFHYTDTYGWSSSTSYDSKPTVTIGLDGSYSGWLFIKSKGLNTFRPRARIISTSAYITGVDVFGTALDLTTTGGILMDSNGSTHATGGNVILAYNESMDLIGTTLAEDNGYPTDTGGYTIAPGGFIMAVCEVCDEEVTYESWNPADWPGHGMPEFTDLDYPCVEQGAAGEVGSDVILPVELASFTATANDGSIALNWNTASETDVSDFEVLRNSELVYTVEARNTANGAEYAWTDGNVENGTTYTYALMMVGMDGSRTELSTVEATPSFNSATITEYALHQNFPNPFNPETSIAFDVVESGFVTLSVYNVLGQEVASLVNGTMDAGRHVVSFDAANLTSGLYLYRMEANGFTAQMKMVLMK
ncbi:T9SS type A sorting domain-containing protein, partial [bacterium]|nr:T9SS type A sorting domain-containing protein [bacterium]